MKLNRPWIAIGFAFFVVCLLGQPTLTYELEAWGYDGTFLLSTNLPPGSDFVSIAAGAEHGVALKSDGTVVAWGNDFYGQNTPPASLGTCIAVGAGGDTAYAIETAGTIVAWGSDYLGTVSSVPAGTYTAVDGGEFFAVALATNGSIVAWGNDSSGQVTNVPSGTDFVQVVAGDTHAVALRSNGSVVGWGAGEDASGHPHWGQAMPPAANDYQAISGGQYWSLSMAGTNEDIFADGFESGDTLVWTLTSP